jgi:hypothetical protein
LWVEPGEHLEKREKTYSDWWITSRSEAVIQAVQIRLIRADVLEHDLLWRCAQT